MIRAIRLSAKLNLELDNNIKKSIQQSAHLLHNISNSRLLDELIKCYYTGAFYKILTRFSELYVLPILFPSYSSNEIGALLKKAAKDTDNRIKNNTHVNLAFLFCTILWEKCFDKRNYINNNKKVIKFGLKLDAWICEQSKILIIPNRLRANIKEICFMQYSLLKTNRTFVSRVVSRRFFRAAYDFLALRANSGEKDLNNLITFWEKYYQKK